MSQALYVLSCVLLLIYTGVTVSLSVPCVGIDNSLIGITGLDLHASEVFDSVIHTNKEKFYAFVVDQEGESLRRIWRSELFPLVAMSLLVQCTLIDGLNFTQVLYGMTDICHLPVGMILVHPNIQRAFDDSLLLSLPLMTEVENLPGFDTIATDILTEGWVHTDLNSLTIRQWSVWIHKFCVNAWVSIHFMRSNMAIQKKRTLKLGYWIWKDD